MAAECYLAKQHKEEILDKNPSFLAALDATMNKEFLNMLQVCLFVPFLHPETPKPHSIPKDNPNSDLDVGQFNMIIRTLNYRNNYGRIVEEVKYENDRAKDKFTVASVKLLKQRQKIRDSVSTKRHSFLPVYQSPAAAAIPTKFARVPSLSNT